MFIQSLSCISSLSHFLQTVSGASSRWLRIALVIAVMLFSAATWFGLQNAIAHSVAPVQDGIYIHSSTEKAPEPVGSVYGDGERPQRVAAQAGGSQASPPQNLV